MNQGNDELNDVEVRCARCTRRFLMDAVDAQHYADELISVLCVRCETRVPQVIIKAMGDCWSYTAGLRDGRIVHFSNVTIKGRWWTLLHPQHTHGIDGRVVAIEPTPSNVILGRGIEVHEDAVLWVVDDNS